MTALRIVRSEPQTGDGIPARPIPALDRPPPPDGRDEPDEAHAAESADFPDATTFTELLEHAAANRVSVADQVEFQKMVDGRKAHPSIPIHRFTALPARQGAGPRGKRDALIVKSALFAKAGGKDKTPWSKDFSKALNDHVQFHQFAAWCLDGPTAPHDRSEEDLRLHEVARLCFKDQALLAKKVGQPGWAPKRNEFVLLGERQLRNIAGNVFP